MMRQAHRLQQALAVQSLCSDPCVSHSRGLLAGIGMAGACGRGCRSRACHVSSSADESVEKCIRLHDPLYL